MDRMMGGGPAAAQAASTVLTAGAGGSGTGAVNASSGPWMPAGRPGTWSRTCIFLTGHISYLPTPHGQDGAFTRAANRGSAPRSGRLRHFEAVLGGIRTLARGKVSASAYRQYC